MKINRALPRKDKFVMPIVDYSQDKDIVEYQVVQKVKKTGEGDDDYIVYDEVVEVSRINRQAYYDKQAESHDLYAIIKKVAETGDTSLLEQGAKGVYLDMTKLPANNLELSDKLAAAEQVWESLPADLKQNMSLGQFVDFMTDEKLAEYVKNHQAEQTEPDKGGNE